MEENGEGVLGEAEVLNPREDAAVFLQRKRSWQEMLLHQNRRAAGNPRTRQNRSNNNKRNSNQNQGRDL